jgi:hypothetical protein
VLRRRLSSFPDATQHRGWHPHGVKLADWIDEYRLVVTDDIARPVADRVDDWEEPALLAPADRVHDTSPRWLERATRVGYARAGEV